MKKLRWLACTAAMMTFALAAPAQHGKPAGVGGGSRSMGHQPNTHSTGSASATHGRRTLEQKLAPDSKLAGKITDLTGMPAQDACSGFKNLGQCVAAAHVSQNLGLTFADLKNTMLALNPDGTPSTTAKPMSLGKAIQTLDPQANAKSEVKKATQQADSDAQSTPTGS